MIDPSSLSIQQLASVKEEIEEEIKSLRLSVEQLSMAMNRFSASHDAVSRLSQEEEGHDILVPLTGAMYVPGKIVDTKNVLVDIGTGYLVEMSSKAAQEHMQRKVQMISTNIERISAALRTKKKHLQIIMMSINMKYREQQGASVAAK
eukprot:c20545_g3_i1.p1 GENE.c20545_g3_i1~~c20545_g3_i1.p1  ORF type:complete len:158 (+),score=83.09 c20545_g3_i1:33-476(+)